MKKLLAMAALLGMAAGIAHFLHSRQQRAWAGRGAARGYYDGEPLPDDVLEQRVQHAVARVAVNGVDARVSHGTVVLRGTLPRSERDRALAAVLAVPGVTQVANYLEAEMPAPGAMPQAAPG